MNLLPVIARELRATSRLSGTYWLRVAGAAAALVAVLLFAGPALDRSLPGSGAIVFAVIHCVLFFSIWLGVPWLVGDCISRERREGTLGLLFLTSLRPVEIVLAKVLVHGLRAFSIWLAVLPVMSVAFLLGGVGWQEALLSVSVNLSALFLALAAGLIATSLCRQWLRAMVLATCLSLILMVCCLALWDAGLALMSYALAPLIMIRRGFYQPGQFNWPGMGVPFSATSIAAGTGHPLAFFALKVGLALVILIGALLLAARRVRSSWQEVPPPVWVQRLDAVFCQPRYGKGLLRAWMKWQIERNPIGWLEQRRWTGRIVVWSWFAVIISIYSGVFANPQFFMRGFDAIQVFLCGAMLLFLSTSAAGSFRRERETGVLELLLIAPISEQRIIGGRLRGLWGKFLPTLALMTFVWISFPPSMGQPVAWLDVFLVIVAFVALPVIGLYQSLRRAHFIGALIWTLIWGLIVPFLAPEILLVPLRLLANLLLVGGPAGGPSLPFRMVMGLPGFSEGRVVCAILAQFLLALGFGALLHRNLVQRKFALERTDGG